MAGRGIEHEDEQMIQRYAIRTFKLTVLAGASAVLLAACERPLDVDLRGGFGDPIPRWRLPDRVTRLLTWPTASVQTFLASRATTVSIPQ